MRTGIAVARAWVGLALGVTLQAQTADVVRLERIPGVDTYSRLDPSWTEVEVLDLGPRPFRVIIPGVDYVRREIASHDVIALARVVDTRGRARTAEDWIDTAVEAELVEVMKPPSGTFAAGGRITFVDTGGGTVTIGRTRLTMRVPWSEAYARDAVYLVTLLERGGELLSPASSGYAVRNGVLHDRDQEPLAGLGGRSLDEVRALVRGAR